MNARKFSSSANESKMNKIAIHSVPRSGSTWLGSIFDSCPNVKYALQPLFSYAFKDFLTLDSTFDDIDLFFNSLKSSDDDFINQIEAKRKGIVPSFQKFDVQNVVVYKEVRYHHLIEHLLEKDTELKVIGLIRNPMAVINSWIHAKKEFRPDLGWKVSEEWYSAPKKNNNKIEEFNGFLKWLEVVKMFESLQAKYPNRFTICNYNDLILDTHKTINDLFKFCDLEVCSATLKFIDDANAKEVSDAYGVYRKKRNDDDKWKLTLPKYIVEEIMNNVDFQKLNSIYKWV